LKLPEYSTGNVIRGLLIYSAGDTTASLIISEFSVIRMVGIMAVGAVVYAWEIPAWFRYIEKKYSGSARAAMAVLYFNPLWIARHLAFISLFSNRITDIHWTLLAVSVKSFAVNLPVAFAANYLIQNKVSLKWRFLSSAIFSSLMAIFYPLCMEIFK